MRQMRKMIKHFIKLDTYNTQHSNEEAEKDKN